MLDTLFNVLRGINGAGHQMNFRLQANTGHTERLFDSFLAINQKFLRQDMKNFLISWDRDRLSRINHSIDIGLKNLSVADRDDPVRAHTPNVTASNPCVDGLNLATSHEFGLFNRPLDGLHC